MHEFVTIRSFYRQVELRDVDEYKTFQQGLADNLDELLTLQHMEPGGNFMMHQTRIHPNRNETLASIVLTAHDGDPIGLASLMHIRNIDPDSFFATFITRMYVRPEYRHKGYSRSLYDDIFWAADYIHANWQKRAQKPSLMLHTIIIPTLPEFDLQRVGIRRILESHGAKQIFPDDPDFLITFFGA